MNKNHKISTLSKDQIRHLKSMAHSLKPVVQIGKKGISDSLVLEIDQSLTAHELIKIQFLGDQVENRDGLISEICERTDANFIANLGKICILFRQNEENSKIEF